MLDVVDNADIKTVGVSYTNRKNTSCVCVVYHPKEESVEDIWKEQRRNGMFDVGVHFLITTTGIVYKGIPIDSYAEIMYSHSEDGVYIMMIGCKMEAYMTASQQKALDGLLACIRKKYGDMDIPIIHDEEEEEDGDNK